MKFIKLLITAVFTFTSLNAFAIEGMALTAKETKTYHGMMVTVADQLNKAGTVKGLLKSLKKSMNPEFHGKLKALLNETVTDESARIPRCAVKAVSLLCGNDSIEMIGNGVIRINGVHEYTYDANKDALAVTRDLIDLMKTKNGHTSLLGLLLPAAHASFSDGNMGWGGMALAAGAGLLLGWLLFGKKKNDQPANVTNNYTTINRNYYYGPNGPFNTTTTTTTTEKNPLRQVAPGKPSAVQ